MKEIKNDYDAFVLALTLSITAPTEKKHKAARKIAMGILPRLTKKQVSKAKNVVSNETINQLQKESPKKRQKFLSKLNPDGSRKYGV